jgi:hypothetical protein
MVRGQLAAKHGQDVHFSHAGVRLGFALHEEPFARKVDVSPAQVGQLSNAKPGEEERREQCAAVLERVDEKDVRNMIRRGELQDVSSDGRRRLDPDEVIIFVEKRVAEGELSPHVFVELAALIAGRL